MLFKLKLYKEASVMWPFISLPASTGNNIFKNIISDFNFI